MPSRSTILSYLCTILIASLLFIFVMPFRAFSIDLLKAYETALRDNPEHLAELYNLEASKAYKWEGLSYLLPHISFTYSKARYDFLLAPVYYRNYTSEYYAFNFNQPLLNISYYERYKAMLSKSKMSSYRYKNEKNDLGYRVAEAYFDALNAYGTLIIAKKEKDIAKTDLDIAVKMFKAGLVGKDDVALAQSRYDVTISTLIEAQFEYKTYLAKLESVINRSVKKLVLLKKSVEFSYQKKPLQYWIDTAIRNNPRIKYYRENENYYKYNLKRTIADQLPNVSFFTTYAHTNSNNYIGTKKTTYRVYGIQINIPIFDGGNTVASIDEAEYRVKQAIENTRDQTNQVIANVKNAYFSLQGDKLKIEALRSALKAAKIALEGAYKGLKAGTKTIKDIVDNEKNMYEIKKSLYDAECDYLKNLVALKNFAGTLTDNDIVEINNKYLQHGWLMANRRGVDFCSEEKTFFHY